MENTAISGVSPYLCVAGAAQAIAFYKQVFEAEEVMRLTEPSGRIGHAEIRIGGSHIMLSDEHPEIGCLGPKSLGGARPPVAMHVMVGNVDSVYRRALDAGATSLREPRDEFYGHRTAQISDPFGHTWFLGQQLEALSDEEITRRFNDLVKESG